MSRASSLKITIGIIALVLIVGGILTWHYFSKEETAKENQAEKVAVWRTYKNEEEGYTIKHLAGSSPNNPVLVYFKKKVELENPELPESAFNRPVKYILQIFKKDLKTGEVLKFIDVEQEKRPVDGGISVQRIGNFIVVVGLGQDSSKKEIFDISGNLVKDLKAFPLDLNKIYSLATSRDGQLYAYTLFPGYSYSSSSHIEKKDWGTIIVKNYQGKEIMRLPLAGFKEKTNTESFFSRFSPDDFVYPKPLGFRDKNHLYLSLQVLPPLGFMPGYLFLLDLETKEIKEITSIRREKLFEGLEYNINPEKGLAYGMKRGRIGYEGACDEPPTELFIIDLDKDKYISIIREEKLLAGSYACLLYTSPSPRD